MGLRPQLRAVRILVPDETLPNRHCRHRLDAGDRIVACPVRHVRNGWCSQEVVALPHLASGFSVATTSLRAPSKADIRLPRKVLASRVPAPGGASVACFGAAATGHSTRESLPKHYNNQNGTNADGDCFDGAHPRLLRSNFARGCCRLPPESATGRKQTLARTSRKPSRE